MKEEREKDIIYTILEGESEIKFQGVFAVP